MIYFLPYLISLLIGWLIIFLLLPPQKQTNLLLRLSLSFGLGLGISASLTFYSFIIFDKLNKVFVLLVHLCLLLWLLASIYWKHRHCENKEQTANGKQSLLRDCFAMNYIGSWLAMTRDTKILKVLLGLGLIAATTFLLWTQANFYPLGGWDAWSVWNVKSRFLFLGGQQWENMFHPILWRSSQHYPLLLPLINVWGWIFSDTPTPMIPLVNSIIFTFLTAALLFSGLKTVIKTFPALLAALLLVSSPTFVVYATSQYCDIVLAYFLLAVFVCLTLSRLHQTKSLALLAGLLLGFLSFTKPEGTLASLLMACLAIFYLSDKKGKKFLKGPLFISLSAGLLIGFLPTILFHVFYAPANQTFINGLNSAQHPVTMERLKIITMYVMFEFMSRKWHGLWALLFIGLLFSQGRCWKKEMMVLFFFLISYAFMTTLYYWLNTYFEITWWLTVTLPRILSAVLPVVIFWVFYSVWGENFKEKLD